MELTKEQLDQFIRLMYDYYHCSKEYRSVWAAEVHELLESVFGEVEF